MAVLHRGQVRAVDDHVAITVNTPLNVDVLNNDRGSNLEVLRVNNLDIIDGGPAIDVGDAQVELSGGELVITPDTDFTGPIVFTYTVGDGQQVRKGVVVGSVT